MVLLLQTVRLPTLVKLNWNNSSFPVSFRYEQNKIKAPRAIGRGAFIFISITSV